MATSDPVPATGRTGVTVEHVWCTYRTASGEVVAVADASATFDPGRVHVLAGPSGAGKSTLLRTIGLLERPSEGRVWLGPTDTSRLKATARRRLRARHVVHLFPKPTENLVDHLDAAGNVVLAARLRGRDVDADAALAAVGLAHRAHHPVHRLSGGEQQRVAFATAVAAGAAVVTADEPTAELDRASAGLVVDALRVLADGGASVVVASHDPLVIDAADTVLRLVPPGQELR